MKEAAYRPSGFDYLRLVLATAVICQHSVNVSYGMSAAFDLFRSDWRPLCAVILPMFFALSGFVVAGSLARCRSLVSFLGFRAIRLVPALAVEILLSALIIGPLVTSFPLLDYVRDKQFLSYFLNIFGLMHYELPGVFLANPWPKLVNPQLWTIPVEAKCYATLACLAALGIVSKRRMLLLTMLIVQFALFVYVANQHPPLDILVNNWILIFCFLWGIVFYGYRDLIWHSPAIFGICLLLTAILLSIPGGDYAAAPPITYVTVYLGLLNPRKPHFFFSGDYSYGMYIYGLPLQQLVASVSPLTREWYVSILIGVPAAFSVAHLSWWCVEKPAQQLKKKIVSLEAYILELESARYRSSDVAIWVASLKNIWR